MRNLLRLILLAMLAYISPSNAEERLTLKVLDPYLEMRTGPARGYPVFYVVERGERVEVSKRRTDWFKVVAPRGQEGWVYADDMSRTLDPFGEEYQVVNPSFADYRKRRWEGGLSAGDFNGANVISAWAGYTFTRNISTEIWASQILGDFSDGWMGSINLVHTLLPERRISPFFLLGAGLVRIEPKATLVDAEDRTDEVAQVGAGVRWYFSRRVSLRAEYRGHLVLTDRDENEDVDEWKLGFAVFF